MSSSAAKPILQAIVCNRVSIADNCGRYLAKFQKPPRRFLSKFHYLSKIKAYYASHFLIDNKQNDIHTI